MRWLQALWNDEAGVLLSAEAAIVGTVAVLAAGAGLNVVATSVNEELKEVGYALRSLDQSYSIPAHKGCRAWTAGSEFKQQPVEESLAELRKVEHKAEAAAKKHSQRLKEQARKQKKRQQQQRKRRMEKRQQQQQEDAA